MNNNRIVVQVVINDKTHVEFFLLLNMQAPLSLKKLQTPLDTNLLTTIRPPLAEGQRGVWELQANAAPTWGRRPRKPMGRALKGPQKSPS